MQLHVVASVGGRGCVLWCVVVYSPCLSRAPHHVVWGWTQIFGDDDGEEVKVPHWDGSESMISESEYIQSVRG